MMKIILVDDDELVRSVLVEILRDAGHEVVETANPHEALGLPGAIGPPGLVITDIDLQSTLNGFARDRYLQKPFSQTRLLGAIEDLMSAA